MQFISLTLVVIILATVFLLIGCARPPAPSAAVLASPHFRDGIFHNLDPAGQNDKSLWDVLKWRLTAERSIWPDWVDDNVATTVMPRVNQGLRVTMINHASLLVQGGGVNILTDPVYAERASPFSFAGPKRARAPGIAFDDLPPIDAVVISHGHYDHLDRATLQRLEDKFKPRFYVPLRNADLMPATAQGRVTEMDWGQRAMLSADTEIVFTPAQHWAARGVTDRSKRFWGAYLLRFNTDTTPRQVYFAGDTGYNTHFKAIRDEFGTVDVALLPIGAYEPRWFMQSQHMNPDDAVAAHLDLGASQSIGIHFGTFQLTDEAIDAPITDLQTALQKRSLTTAAFKAPKNGESFAVD